jgi:hypothetical protein
VQKTLEKPFEIIFLKCHFFLRKNLTVFGNALTRTKSRLPSILTIRRKVSRSLIGKKLPAPDRLKKEQALEKLGWNNKFAIVIDISCPSAEPRGSGRKVNMISYESGRCGDGALLRR